jgi:hypothetical protein
VTHTEKAAQRYGDNIYQVDLSGAQPIHYDDEGGYFYVRPKKSKSANTEDNIVHAKFYSM